MRRYFDTVLHEYGVRFAWLYKKLPGKHTLKSTHPEVEFLSTLKLYRGFESFWELFLLWLRNFSNYNYIVFLYISKSIPEVNDLEAFLSLPKHNTTNTNYSLDWEHNHLGINLFERYEFLHVCYDINIQNQTKEA